MNEVNTLNENMEGKMDDVHVKLAELEARGKSNSHRLDKVEACQTEISELVTAMSVVKNEQTHIKSDVVEIKEDVKVLTNKSAKRWDGIVEKLIWFVISGVAGYLAAQFIK